MTLPTLREISDAAWKWAIVAILAASTTYLSGIWGSVKAGHAFFQDAEKIEVTYKQVEDFMASTTTLGEELGQLQQALKTVVGEVQVYSTDKSMTALVNRRSPYKRGDRLTVMNLSSVEQRSIGGLTVVGDFVGGETLILQVSPDAGSALGIPSGRSIRAEVKPEGK